MKIVAPPPDLTISEWADAKRQVSQEVSSEPGRWKTERTPYLKEMMDCVTDPDVEQVVVMKAARMGATEVINNAIGYHIDYDPCPILYVQQTIELGERYSKKILAPMIRDTPVLAEKVAEPRSRDSSSTILEKVFPGGDITIIGANSPRGFRMVAKRIIIGDDIDGFESNVGDEGDPVDLSIRRADTFWNKKIILVSSPTNKGLSRIEQKFEESDKRYFHIPCPICGTFQHLKWGQLKWEKDKPETVHYECCSCRKRFYNYHKVEILKAGKWIATAPFKKIAGFHINKLYSPWVSWQELVEDFLEAKKSRETLKVFINTALGETWEDEGEQVSDIALFSRREKYGPEIPEQVVVLTAGVDVQDDRIEVGVEGWGLAEESWDIEYKILYGDVKKPEIWKHLDEFLLKNYRHVSGYSWRISSIAIDSGDNTKHVYEFVRPRQIGRNIWAIKGSNTHGIPIISKPSKNIPGISLYHVGTDTAKDLVFGRLKIIEPGPGFIHFPFEFDEEYFKQLTAEKKVIKHKKGFRFYEWIKTRDRNEVLDIKVYNIVALHIAQSRHYPNNTVSQMLEKLSQNYAHKVQEIEKKIPAPVEKPRRRLLSKVSIY